MANADFEASICLRGPCKYLKKQTCTQISGYEIDLTDVVVFDCNSFDPTSPDKGEKKNG